MTAPTRRERFRPLELVAIAAVLGAFAGVIVLLVTRQPLLAAVFTGVAFIASLLVLAMLALAAGSPDDADDARPLLERHDPKPGEEPGRG